MIKYYLCATASESVLAHNAEYNRWTGANRGKWNKRFIPLIYVSEN